jgi:hypothetical protein
MARQLPHTSPLPAERAFVVQFDAATLEVRGYVAGRVEHIVSAQATHFRSWEELQAFVTRVLMARSAAPETAAEPHPPRE